MASKIPFSVTSVITRGIFAVRGNYAAVALDFTCAVPGTAFIKAGVSQMDENLNELLVRLSDSILDENFMDVAYDITEEIEGRTDAFDAVAPILKLIENNPAIDFGNPGPLVHFLETFYKKGYEEKLVESLKRQPTKHTVWMLNRIINGSEKEIKNYFINVLLDVLKFPNISNDLVLIVKQFNDLHK